MATQLGTFLHRFSCDEEVSVGGKSILVGLKEMTLLSGFDQ